MSERAPGRDAHREPESAPPPSAGGRRLPMAGTGVAERDDSVGRDDPGRVGAGARATPEGASKQGWDLNGNRLTRFLLTNRRVQPTLQILVLGIFGWALWQAFFGPANPDANFATVAFFGMWWTPVMLLSLLFFGRIWCYVCPIGAITQFLQRFSLNRRFPTFRKPKWKVFGLGLSVLSIAALSFTLARLPLYKYGVAFTPTLMGIYFLVFLGIAVGLTFVFRQRVFCRYFCPATGVMSVTTRLSPFEIRQDRDSKVPDCMTAEFKSRYLSTERRCVACMHCTTDQPEVPVRLRARWPGAAAVRHRLLIPDEALIALIIWAVFPIDHVLGSRFIETLPAVQALPGVLAGATPYYGSILAAILAFAGVGWLAARWSGLDARAAFTRFAFAYVPLGISFQIGEHLIPGLMEDGGGLLNRFAAGVGVPLDLPVAWASVDTLAWWQGVGSDGFLWLGVAWSVAIAWAVATDMARDRARAVRAVVPHLVLMVATTWGVLAVLG